MHPQYKVCDMGHPIALYRVQGAGGICHQSNQRRRPMEVRGAVRGLPGHSEGWAQAISAGGAGTSSGRDTRTACVTYWGMVGDVGWLEP